MAHQSYFNLMDQVGGLANAVLERQHEEATLRDTGGSSRSLLELALRFVDQKKNDEDPYGDGDQSYVKATGPADPGQRLKDLWCEGGGEQGLFSLLRRGLVPPLFINCLLGNVEGVRQAISETTDPIARMQMLESRVSVIRLTPLMVCIVGARSPCIDSRGQVPPPSAFLAVADLLCEAGCRVDAKDVAGYSATAHCTTATSSPASLAIFRLLMRKYNASITRSRFDEYTVYEAIMSNRADNMEALLEHGAVLDDLARKMVSLWPAGLKLHSQILMPHRRRKIEPGNFTKVVYVEPGSPLFEHKGAVGEVLGYDYLTGLYGLKLESGQIVNLKRHNLDNSSCEVCGVRAQQKCSKCSAASYCGRDCQVSDWKTHKKVCVSTTPSSGKAKTVLVVKNHEGEVEGLVGTRLRDMKEMQPTNTLPQKGSRDASTGELIFPVKVQVPLDGAEGGSFFIYNKDRSFNAFCPSSKSVRAFITGTNQYKGYFNCRYDAGTDTGRIEISTENMLPLQRF